MTEVPPPSQYPGGYPPPGGPVQLPGSNFEVWIKRVGAFIIDWIPAAVLVWIGQAIAAGTATVGECGGVTYGDPLSGGGVSYAQCGPEYTGVGWTALLLFYAAGIAFAVWNWGFKQGTTGSSIGKGVLGLSVLGEATGQPIGFGPSVLRQIAHFLDAIILYIGFLLPLFTPKRQTIADMLLKTVVVPNK